MTITGLYILFFFFLIISILVYFRLANRYKIVDKPNHRSSHSALTIRGGGIIFSLAIFALPIFFTFSAYYFISGLAIISTISFIDDLQPISNKIRVFCHLLGVSLLFYQLHVFQFPLFAIIICYIVTIGTINAINFMDGINGMTGLYALVTLVSLFLINNFSTTFISQEIIICSSMSLLVFLIFNLRTKAKCFAGDVGSVGIAFIIIYVLLSLIILSDNFKYILLLLIYGLDTISTIAFRLIRRENIFEAHRSHFYQYLANHTKLSHITISTIYAVIQLLVNLIVILILPSNIFLIAILIILSIVLFVVLRFCVEGRSRLLGNN